MEISKKKIIGIIATIIAIVTVLCELISGGIDG